MPNRPWKVDRPSFFRSNQLERIEETALDLLEQIGIAVLDEGLREQLRRAGFASRGNRLLVERPQSERFLSIERQRHGDRFAEGPHPLAATDRPIEIGVLSYPQWVHDLETDTLIPFTKDRLAEATRLLDVLGLPGVPGCPVDEPPLLQPVVQYWIAATCSRQGRQPVDPKSLETLPHIMAMAEVLGNPIEHLPVYVFSPLILGGESLRCALHFRDRLSWISISDMSSLGCTAPLAVGHAFAVSAAEVIGAAVLLETALELPVHWSIRVCPVDLRFPAMVLGSPEDLLLMLAAAEVNAFFHGTPWHPATVSLHTAAKLPGAQACSEKASLMTVGALLGARSFGYVGTLSLDEAFSAEQLLYDLEIRDQVQRLIAGFDGDCDPKGCLQEVEEALEQGSFAGLETTRQGHRDFYWYPKLFERGFLSTWEARGRPNIRQQVREMIAEHLARHDYELEPSLRRELDRLVAQARADLANR